MLRPRNVQPSLWESVLPEICLRLPAELERVDAWLDDDRFFAPFVPRFSARMGRPSIPIETYLRLMFLKHRYRLRYEWICGRASDSIPSAPCRTTSTGWDTSRYAARCPTPSPGDGSAASTSTPDSRTRLR